MSKQELLNKTLSIVLEAHKTQVDKNGDPYIGHLFRVMQMGKTMDEKICGLLHDLIEDTDWTFDKLKAEGYPEHIIEALRCLTKISEDEPYEDFIKRVTMNKLAISVKINDLTDNLDVKRYQTITEREVKRINKYLKWHRFLSELDIKIDYYK